MTEAKKMTILRIYNILEEYSDSIHPLTQGQIIELLREKYGIAVERKAVARNLEMLSEAGFDIVRTKKGSYLENKLFENSEIRVLIDSVLSSRHINAKHSADLINKLIKMGGRHFRSFAESIYQTGDWQKSDNFDFFLNVEILDDAIRQGSKVRFFYNRMGADKKYHRTTTEKHLANPYQLFLHNQHYYLISMLEQHKNLTFFRLDRITDIELTEIPAVPLESLPKYKNGLNIPKLISTLPYLYSEEPVKVTLRCNDWMINEVADWFGKDFCLAPQTDGWNIVTVEASPSAIVYWIMQYSENVEVLSPPKVRSAVIEKLKLMQILYLDEEN